MRRVIHSTCMSVDGVVQEPQRWTLDHRSEDAARYGCGPLTTTLIREHLLDETQIWLHPLFSGDIEPTNLISHHATEVTVRLADARRYDSGVIVPHYQPI